MLLSIFADSANFVVLLLYRVSLIRRVGGSTLGLRYQGVNEVECLHTSLAIKPPGIKDQETVDSGHKEQHLGDYFHLRARAACEPQNGFGWNESCLFAMSMLSTSATVSPSTVDGTFTSPNDNY